MTEKSNQPKEYDAVLGGKPSVPADGVVLGGVDRVKQVLAVEGVEQKIDALLDALQYGKKGLDLVIQALDDKSEEVQEAAYWLLQDSPEPRVKLALHAYNPYLFFEYLYTIDKYTDEDCRIAYVDLSSEQQKLVTYDYNGTIKVCNMQTQQVICTFQQEETKRISQVVITPDDQILGGWHNNDSAEVWDLKTGDKILTTHQSGEMFWTAVINQDGSTLVSTGDDNIFSLWDIRAGQYMSYVHIPKHLSRRYFVYSDSQILVTEHAVYNNADKKYDRILELWDWQTERSIGTFNTHSQSTPLVALSPDRRLLVSGSEENGTIKVWSVLTGHELSTHTMHLSSMRALALSLDGQKLFIWNENTTVQVWGVP